MKVNLGETINPYDKKVDDPVELHKASLFTLTGVTSKDESCRSKRYVMGNKEEFSLWLETRQVMLIAAARGICFDKEIAEEVLQEALMDVYRRWSKIKDHENLEAYTIRVIISKHIDLRRKWNRKRNENELEYSEAFAASLLEENTDAIIESVMVQNALKALSAIQRAVLMLHYMYGYTLKDISVLLQIPPGTVASHLARGKAAISERVEILPQIIENEHKTIEDKKSRELNERFEDGRKEK